MSPVSKSKIVLHLFAIFVAGALAGAVGGYSVGRQEKFSDVRPDELAGRIKRQLQSRLQLSPEQMKQLEPSVQEVCGELRAIGYHSALNTGRAYERFNQRIAPFLTPAQEAALDQLQRERKETVKRRCKSWTNADPARATR